MVSKVISPSPAFFILSTHFPINRSIIPTMCALPADSGLQHLVSIQKFAGGSNSSEKTYCQINGNDAPKPFSLLSTKHSFSHNQSNRSHHIFSITSTLTYPCEFGVYGKKPKGVISSPYHDPGISTRPLSADVDPGLGTDGMGDGCIHVLASFE